LKKIISKINKILKKPRVERAIKTFIEAFFSYIAVNIMTVDITNRTGIYALIAGAIGSALSVILNINKNGESYD